MVELSEKDVMEAIEEYISFIEEIFGEIYIDDREEKKEGEGNIAESGRNQGGGGLGSREKISVFDKALFRCLSLPDPYNIVLEEKKRLINDIADRIRSCKNCELWRDRKKAVPGDGAPSAQVVFVGEAPGYEEDKSGKPFVGKSGKLLEKIIKEELKLSREQVFITNVVRCRPPNNRTPTKPEIDACSPYLFEELRIIKPKLVVALGAPAAKVLLGKEEKISELRGQYFTRPGYTVFVTFHPAFVVRNPNQMEIMTEDFRKIKELLEKL